MINFRQPACEFELDSKWLPLAESQDTATPVLQVRKHVITTDSVWLGGNIKLKTDLLNHCSFLIDIQHRSRGSHSPNTIDRFPFTPKSAPPSEPHVKVVNPQQYHHTTQSINSGENGSCFGILWLDKQVKDSKTNDGGKTENSNEQVPQIHSATRSQAPCGQTPLSREKKEQLWVVTFLSKVNGLITSKMAH